MKFCYRLQGWLVAFIFLFAVVSFGGVHDSSIYWIRILVLLGLPIQMVLLFSEERYFSDFPFAFWISSFLFFLFLGLVYFQYFFGTQVLSGQLLGSINPGTTYSALIQLLVYFAFFMICVKLTSKREWLERAGSFLAVLVFVVAVLGLAQRMSEERILWKYFSQTPTSFFGPFINENHFGGFLGLTFPLALALMHYRFIKAKEELSHHFDSKRQFIGAALMNRGVIFFFFLVIITLGACFFSVARLSAFVLLFCCVSYFVVYGVQQKNLKFYVTLCAILTGSFLLLQWLGFDLIAHGFGWKQLQNSWDERSLIAKQSLALWRGFPVFGTGLGTYGSISSKVVSYSANQVWWDHVHNDYIELLIETGMVGFFLLLSSIGTVLFFSISEVRKNVSRWNRAIASQSVIAIICMGVMELSDFHLKIPALALLFTFQLACLTQSSHGLKNDEGQTSWNKNTLLKWFFALGFLSLFVFGFIVSANDVKTHWLFQKQENRLSNLKKAVELKPLNPELWFELGKEYKKSAKKAREETLKALRQAVLLSPTRARYRFYLGVTEYSFGYEKEGVGSLEKAIFWSPFRLQYSVYLLAVYLREAERAAGSFERIKFLDKAKTLYGRLKKLDVKPDESQYQKWMGDYYYDKLTQLIPYWVSS